MDANALLSTLASDRVRFVDLARRRVANDADADDIVQSALIRAVDRAGSLEDPARAHAWFYRILRNAIVDHHRTRREDPMRHRAEVDLDELQAASSGTPASSCLCSIRLLAELRPAYAEVIRRIDVEDEEPAAVAQSLGIAIGNLHVRLHRARRILREDIQHYCGVASHRPCLDCSCDAHRRCGAPI